MKETKVEPTKKIKINTKNLTENLLNNIPENDLKEKVLQILEDKKDVILNGYKKRKVKNLVRKKEN